MKKFGQFNKDESVDEAASMMKVIGAKTLHRKKYKKAIDFIKKKLKTVENIGATKVFRVAKIVDKYSLPIDAKVAYELLQKESVNAKAARQKIKSEKDADKVKFDRMMDQARRRDTSIKNRSEAMAVQDPDIKDREGSQPAAYHKGLKKSTKAKRDSHFKKHGPKSDSDDSAYADAPGDKEARKENMPKSKYTKFVDSMMKEGTNFADHRAAKANQPTDADRQKMSAVAALLKKERDKKAATKKECWDGYVQKGLKKKGKKTVPNCVPEEAEQISENSFAEKSKKSGISVGTLRKVYNRGVAAWKTGHRPGTTPQQWGHGRVNAFIAKKKKGGLNHDKDLA